MWGCSDSSFSVTDERREEFVYREIYNKVTDKIEKRKKEMKKKKKCCY